MKRFNRYAAVAMMGSMGMSVAFAGEASTSASAGNGIGGNGTAGATANYDGHGGLGFARTRADSGKLSRARGIAVGFDEDGLDVSFSHALASRFGPAYAGTFNMSIGLDGQVNSGYGSVLSQGGLARSAEAGGSSRSDRFGGGGATAYATGNTVGGGWVDAQTHTSSRRVYQPRFVQPVVRPRLRHR